MRLEAFIPGLLPTATAQMQKVCMVAGRPRFFKPAAVKAAGRTIYSMLQPHAPPDPLDGPLCVVLHFILPWRASEKKRVVAAYQRVPCAVRPDVDNRAKAVLDVMTTLRFWNDDGQIASLLLHKWYADEPGLRFIITPEEPRTRC